MKPSKVPDTKQKLFSVKRKQLAFTGRTWFHIIIWISLIATLFYALHRYFEFREQQLETKLEQLSSIDWESRGQAPT